MKLADKILIKQLLNLLSTVVKRRATIATQSEVRRGKKANKHCKRKEIKEDELVGFVTTDLETIWLGRKFWLMFGIRWTDLR